MAKNGQNLAVFECFYLYVRNSAKFLYFFGMETLLVFFFEKIILYMPGKILTWPKFGHLLPKFLAKN